MSSIGIHGGSSGGGGGTPADPSEVNVIEYGSAATSLGQKTAAASIPVVLPSDGTLPLPTGAATAAKQDTLLTELQLKADLTETQPVSLATIPAPLAVSATGTLTGAGQNVDLSLAGRTGAGARLVLTGFSGQLNAYVSLNGGTNYGQTFWGELLGSAMLERDSTAETTTLHVWIYVPPGATHVRLQASTLTAGTVAVALSGNEFPIDTLALVTGSQSLANVVSKSIQIGGANSPGFNWEAAAVYSGAPNDGAAGLVVRNRSGLASIVTGPAMSNDGLAHILGIRDITSNTTMEPAIRTDAALTNDRGILVRIIPSTTLSQLVNGTFWQATQPVSGTFWQATQPISVAGTVAVQDVRPTTPAQTSVSVLVTDTQILASNASRLGATLYNESGAIAYVKLGATAGLTSYSIQIAIGGYYEVPFKYTGAIHGITVAITAVLRVTELT